MTYTAQILALGRCVFWAKLDGTGISVDSVNAEYDLCHEMNQAGLPDGPIQFYRGTMRTISFRSVHRAAGWRVEVGDRFPYRLVRRKDGNPEERQNSCRHSMQDGESGCGEAGECGRNFRASC